MDKPLYSRKFALFATVSAGAAALLLGAGSIPAAHANLLLSPAGGTSLFSSALDWDDDVAANRALGFTGHFFGTSFTSVDVSVNGNLNFSGDANFANVALPSSFNEARIAPLWDDLVLPAGDIGSITERVAAGSYYAVTWNNVLVGPDGSGRQTFQAAWFGASTTIGSFTFQPDDIAFSYGSISTGFAEAANAFGATVGLDKGNATAYAPLPGTIDGLIDSSSASLLPSSGAGFVLFRPNGSGGYTASVQSTAGTTVVPEPTSLVLAGPGIGLILLSAGTATRGRRRRQQRRVPAG